MEQQIFLERIADADLCLIGIGEDFDTRKCLNESSIYQKGCDYIKQADALTLLPAWKSFCIDKLYGNRIRESVEKLADILKDKNYFVISLSTNEVIASYPWKHERIVSPCGSATRKQCKDGHGEVVCLSDEDIAEVKAFFDKLYSNEDMSLDGIDKVESTRTLPCLGVCLECGAEMVFNNIRAENYVEAGYLPKWELYKKWLQGTVNRKIVIVELGVGLKYPSVIRWPFEKIAFFNEKAHFFRVHERLSQLTPELVEKGMSIAKNPIDWLLDL